MTEALEGQMSIFDLFPRDSSFGKTYREPLVREPRRAKTSESSLKKSQGSAKKMPLYLDLRKKDGILPGALWETGIPLRGESQTLNTGEEPSETAIQEMCLEWGLHSVAEESRLSQILEEEQPPTYSLKRYYLSAKACQGILNRAERRGKELPEILREALERQAKA